MDSSSAASSKASSALEWLILAFSARNALSPEGALACIAAVICAFVLVSFAAWIVPGGNAWGLLARKSSKEQTIPGPRGWPVFGILFQMGDHAHRRLAELARIHGAQQLMAFSVGSTRMVITSKPDVARELLNSSAFADRPLKQSAQQLLFGRAIGFAPYGDYWRSLRRIASNYLFSPRQIAAQEPARQAETSKMLQAIISSAAANGGVVRVRDFLQRASLNNIMQTVFGRRYEEGSEEGVHLSELVREGFELLGAFNWADHLPALELLDPQNIHQRCSVLVPKVNSFVQRIIDEHRYRSDENSSSDFVDVLLSLEGEEKLQDFDMVAVLWVRNTFLKTDQLVLYLLQEMIFRGTDTVALLTEWLIAEMVLHPEIQAKVHQEIQQVVGESNRVSESDLSKMVYLQAVVKETLRMHPPGPLLSWARLAIHDVSLAGHHVPAGTTAMVNMWSITRDPEFWAEPEKFKPERFIEQDVEVKGTDLRLAPFGAGRRVCPGRALGLATVHLWAARLLHEFTWEADAAHPVDLTEVLKLSSEMASPLHVRPVAQA